MIWLRRVLLGFLALLVLLLASGAGGLAYLRSSLPATSGERVVVGVSAPLTISRDADGVPHIVAQSEADAIFGLGYVHAQDRLWQMEFQRRIGYGRLSEALGPSTIETDRFLRTLGVWRAAERALTTLDAPSLAALEAYAAGVNAFLAGNPVLPPEFIALGLRPEPWRPVDSLVWAKMMAWDLGGNWSDELLRAALVARLGAARAEELLPGDLPGFPTIMPAGAAAPAGAMAVAPALDPAGADALLALSQRIRASTGLGGRMVGSNNWVVAGARSASGAPLLADDPHLGARMPSIWYLASMRGGAIDSIGATLPGLPAVVIGRNQHIAWGVTNTGPDVQDLFIERVDDATQTVEYRGAREPLTLIDEVIAVRGAEPVSHTVRLTRHGPLLSDVTDAGDLTVALRWTALDPVDTTLRAYLELNRAQDWAAFVAAMRHYHAPMQNVVFADRTGDIGYIAPGAVPLRRAGDGRLPAPGWDDSHEWVGYVPFEELPRLFNPPQGYIATANNRVAGADYPHLLGTSWAAPFRAARIVELIEATPRHTPQTMAAIQADVTSVLARELLPVMRRVPAPDGPRRRALELLTAWDGSMRGDSAAAAVFQAYYQATLDAVFADELGELYADGYADERNAQAMALHRVLLGDGAYWCDDITTRDVDEDCPAILARALGAGLATMAALQGADDPAAWRWDRAHHAVFAHTPFSRVDALRTTFERRVPNGGDGFTVNVAPIRVTELYNQYNVPSYRQVVDLGQPEASLYMHTTGQSGNVFSDHFADLLMRWQQVAYLPMRAAAGDGAVLTLRP